MHKEQQDSNRNFRIRRNHDPGQTYYKKAENNANQWDGSKVGQQEPEGKTVKKMQAKRKRCHLCGNTHRQKSTEIAQDPGSGLRECFPNWLNGHNAQNGEERKLKTSIAYPQGV